MKLLGLDRHLRDEDLLLLLEGELSPWRTMRSATHLYGCPVCQNRRAALLAIGRELQVLQAEVSERTSRDPARRHLQSLLANAAAVEPRSPWSRTLQQPRTLARLASVAALLSLSIAWQQAYRPFQDRMGPYEETGPKPDHALTPGAVRPAALADLCLLPDNDLDPLVTEEKARAVFQAYGMNERAARAYQVDYLINPQLGGDDDIENLWPEPYHATVWNATAKDALETRLHSMVCGGQVDLEVAQHDLATDWIAAYKKYFHADRPVSAVAAVDPLPELKR